MPWVCSKVWKSGITMTGSDFGVGVAAPVSGADAQSTAPWEAMASVMSSLPDPAAIAELANAFFKAVPGTPGGIGPSVVAAPPASPAAPSAIPAAGVPGPALPAGAGLDRVGHPATQAKPPASVPGGAGVPSWQLPGVQLPGVSTDPGLDQLLRSLGADLALVPPKPQTNAPGRGPESGAGFYFLDHARLPATAAAAPAPVPARTDPPAPVPGTAAAPAFPEVPELGPAARPFDPHTVRRDFPILQERVHGRPLIWLDNAATTQKPQAVIDRLSYFYQHENSNIHRAAHALAARATDAYEAARDKVRRFLGAASADEIIFVRGTTEGINLIAQAWGRRNIAKDDEIVITWLEHHANIVPWQMLCAETGARLRVAPVDDRGQVILEAYEKLLNPRTRLVSFSQVSNALGTVTPAAEMVAMARRHGACVVVDGAQAVSHMPVNVQALDCDFYVLSGHKLFGPTGIGVVYGKAAVLEHMPPWQGGGNMIADVTFEKTVYQPPPARFEAGTGNIADAVGLGAAIDYLERIGMATINRYEHELLAYATQGLLGVPGLTLIGTAAEKAGVLSFVLDGCRSEDVGAALDREGIAVRSGHHCAQPILRRFGVESTVRPSLAFYNTSDEIDALVAALLRLQSQHG